MNLPKAVFVTGTDTEVGKTHVSCALLAAARQAGLQTAAMKPVASGCVMTAEGLRNADALALQAQCTLPLPYEQINPVALQAAIAPHLAAAAEGRQLSLSRLTGMARALLMARADFTVLEGAGGWRVPLNNREMLSALALELRLPVVLVVGIRLGCINHAILTAEAIQRDGLHLAGWVANFLGNASAVDQKNVETLQDLLPAPLIAELPYTPGQSPDEVARFVNLSALTAA